MKKIIKRILPERLCNQLRLIRYFCTSKMTIEKAEDSISSLYYQKTGNKMNWASPQSYTEKVNFSKLYAASLIKERLTDKIEVRKWVSEIIGNEYLIPLYGVYSSYAEINFDDLPSEFVMKCNHDSGSVFICEDKTKINHSMRKHEFDFYLKRNYAYMTCEMQYKNIPRKIMIEKYMGSAINDYKFLCFDGKPYYCWVDIERFNNHKRNIYDLDWKLQPFFQCHYGNSEKVIERPQEFDEMLDIVERLCKGFDHVRVDLYLVDHRIYFGEMTFTNGSGNEPIIPKEWDYKIGQLWNLDIGMREKKYNRKDKLKELKIYE